MSRIAIATVAAALILSGGLAGCGSSMPGTPRSVGNVAYESAFAAAGDVLRQYGFSIETADADARVIKTRPKAVEAKPDRLLGGRSPAREVATVRIRPQGDQVSVIVSVELQRQESAVLRQVASPEENYDTVPNKTPAQTDAAITPEQGETWRSAGYDHELEAKILEDINQALHPQGK